MLPQVTMLLSIALVAALVYASDPPMCTNIPAALPFPTSDLECPERAVCADAWDTIRDWYNGTRCREHRVNLRCTCPGGMQCPVFDGRHEFYTNSKQIRYLCEQKCDLQLCTTYMISAVEMIQNSPEFDGRNFYRINCRCPGHDFPIQAVPGVLARSTSYKSRTNNARTHIKKTQYRCNRDIPITGDDLCPRKDARMNS